MSATTKVTLEFGMSSQDAQKARAKILEVRRHVDDKYKGYLGYQAELMREIAQQLPGE